MSQYAKMIIGWREWVAFPVLAVPAIKAKIDTGARTSALHVFNLKPFQEDGIKKVQFVVHPLQKRTDVTIHCIANVVDQRTVTNSGGHREKRYVIRTIVRIGQSEWPIEITLTNREEMGFRMLLGRTAMHKRLMVDPSLSYQTGQSLARTYHLLSKR